MPVSQTLSPVLFHGDTIFVVDHQGEPFAPVKPIVENMGLAWQVQNRKLLRNRARWSGEYLTIASAGGPQKTLCIPVKKLPGFLAAINPLKVGEELRPKIIQYREECDAVLWNSWKSYTSKRSESPASQPTQPDLPLNDQKPPQLTQNERDLLATIKTLDSHNRGLADSIKVVNASYVDLLERHVDLLHDHLEAKTKAISADYEQKLRLAQKQVQYYAKRSVNHD